jgi:hypothetical protein
MGGSGWPDRGKPAHAGIWVGKVYGGAWEVKRRGADTLQRPFRTGLPTATLPSPRGTPRARERAREETQMTRNIGDRYSCESCGAQLVYEKGCPCPPSMPHSEICCGKQMKLLSREGAGGGGR